MKTKKYISLFAAALCMAASCQREPTTYTTTVYGYAQTTDSLDPIPFIELDIQTKQGRYTTSNVNNIVRTDATGRFELEYTGPADGQIGIGFGGNGSYHNLGGFDFITPYTTKTHNIQLQPYGWLKLHVKNIDVQSPNDYLGVSAGGANYELIYGLVDKIILWKVPANGRTFLTWTVRKNQIETKYRDTIYCPGFDTTFYEILY